MLNRMSYENKLAGCLKPDANPQSIARSTKKKNNYEKYAQMRNLLRGNDSISILI